MLMTGLAENLLFARQHRQCGKYMQASKGSQQSFYSVRPDRTGIVLLGKIYVKLWHVI